MALSKKQQAFINEYLIDFNATQAAIRAGYSEKAASNIGWENVRKPEIAAAIEKRISEQCMGADEVLMRLAEQARAEYSQFINEHGMVDLEGLIAAGKAHLIKGIKETAHGRTIEFYDGQSALELIGKYHKLFSDKLDVHHSGGIAVKGYTQVSPDDWEQATDGHWDADTD